MSAPARCTCVEDVVCGACMTSAAALSTPPADDVRALEVHYCPEHGDLLEHGLRRRDLRSTRCREAHTVGEIRGEVRPRGTVTDAVSDELLLDSRTIHHARYGGLGGDVASLTITSEAWRRLGKPRAIQVSVTASPKADS